MALNGRTTRYSLGKGPDQVGVYELHYGGNIIYIGYGVIQNRLRSHHRNGIPFQRYRCKITNDRRRAQQIERRELRSFKHKRGRLPKYNERLG